MDEIDRISGEQGIQVDSVCILEVICEFVSCLIGASHLFDCVFTWLSYGFSQTMKLISIGVLHSPPIKRRTMKSFLCVTCYFGYLTY